jgi:hypothetical protein
MTKTTSNKAAPPACRAAPRRVPRAGSSIPGFMFHLCRITAGASPHPPGRVVAKLEVGGNKKVVEMVVVTQG